MWIEIQDEMSSLHAETVVPHAGDVDRNGKHIHGLVHAEVVPHAGDVDRNELSLLHSAVLRMSSPTRGMWIEIDFVQQLGGPRTVVPHAGDVDRNIDAAFGDGTCNGRPPRGGRG